MAQWVISLTVQLHGGNGVRHGFAVETFSRDIRALRIHNGTIDVQRAILARSLLS